MPKLYPLCKTLFFVLLISYCSHLEQTYAQVTLSGQVRSYTQQQPLQNVSVRVKETSDSTLTQADGSFQFLVGDSARTVIVSHPDFITQQVPITGPSGMQVELTPKTEGALVEWLYVHMPSSRNRVATSLLTREQLQLIPVSSFAQQLQGQVAGVLVSNDYSPGGGSMVRLRGFGSFYNDGPLLVVDGVPFSDVQVLNPQDIDSITILKDASASALYGIRGGNGVVIITTKKAVPTGLSVNVDMSNGVNWFTHFPDMLSTPEYADFLWQSSRNVGSLEDNGNPVHLQYGNGPRPVIPDYIVPIGGKEGDPETQPKQYSSGNPITRTNKTGTNWFKEIFRPAYMQNYYVSASQGSTRGRLLVSMGYLNQQGSLMHTSFKRYTSRINGEWKVNKLFTIGENSSYIHGQRVGIQSYDPNGPLMNAYRMEPSVPVYDIKGNFTTSEQGGRPSKAIQNPVAQLSHNQDNAAVQHSFLTNAYITTRLSNELTARAGYGINYSLAYEDVHYPNSPVEFVSGVNRNSRAEVTLRTWTTSLAYAKQLAFHQQINITVAAEHLKTESSVRGKSSEIPIYARPGDSPGQFSTHSFRVNTELGSYRGQLKYSFQDKYLLEGVMRIDGPTLGKPKEYKAVFPAINVSWRISKEPFLRGVRFVDELLLQAGWGQAGNRPLQFYGSSGGRSLASIQSAYSLNEMSSLATSGSTSNPFFDPGLFWEKISSTHGGFTSSLFKRRLFITVDAYERQSHKLLTGVPGFAPGFSTHAADYYSGRIRNSGMDIDLEHKGQVWAGKLRFSAGLTISLYRNQVLQMDFDPLMQNIFVPGSATHNPKVGQPIASFKGYSIDGIFQNQAEANVWANHGVNSPNQPGQFRFRDINGDTLVTSADQVWTGNPHPDLMYGFHLGLTYTHFDFSLVWQGMQGNELYNYTRSWTDFAGFKGNQSKRILTDSWKPGKTDAKLAQINVKDVYSRQPSTYYIENGSYLRLKAITLGYNLAVPSLTKYRIKNCRIYVQALNLLTLTKYTGLDPEVGLNDATSSSNTGLGMDAIVYPAAKFLQVGLQVQF